MPITINGTTGIAGVDGSAGTPAVQGTDTNTGIFFPAADTVAISAAGSEDFRIGPAGQIGIQGANYGTSGQVLRSNGSAAAPSWGTISSTGSLIRAPQILTSGTSYTTPSNCTAIYVEAVGGGGNGGSTNQGTAYSGAGGGAGAYCAKYFTVTGSTAYTYAIGAGGSGRNDGTQVSGGNTTFTVGATTITAGGGGGGGNSSGASGGGGGGTASNGDINVNGTDGNWGMYVPNTNNLFIRGGGGSSVFGGGGPTMYSSGNNQGGANARGYGSGGSGATGNVQTSGSGSQGIIRIWEYT